MRDLENNEKWLDVNGKTFKKNGIKYIVKVRTFNAIYPYSRKVIDVIAEPVNKNSATYLREKKNMGDDWCVDVLESEMTENVYQQLFY